MRRPRLPVAPGDRAARRRRRRLWPALGVIASTVVVLAVVVVSSSGHDGSTLPVLGPGGSVSVVTGTGQGTQAAPRTPEQRPFTPAPAAVTAANKLSLSGQVAQLFMVSVDGGTTADVATLGSLNWAGVVLTRSNFGSDGQVGALAGAIASAAHSSGGTPPLVAATQEGGADTAFPDLPPESEPVVGSSGEPAVAEAQARLAGKRLRQLGVNMTVAPLADVDTPEGALSGRLFSTDPRVVARLSVAAVSGYSQAGVVSAAGHFPGSGASSADPDQMTATVGGTLGALRARDLIPFSALAASAPVIVMSNAAYVAFDGVTPAGLLPQAVDLLRHELGFQGVVMSDDLDATLQPTAETPGAVALQALNAGDDLLYITGPPSEHMQAYEGLLAAAEHSAAERARVRSALLRVLTLKVRYGILR